MEKSIKNSLGILFLITLFCLIMLAIDFIAMHDVKNDYVSPKILGEYNLQLPEDTEWTAAVLEWTSLRISWVLKLALLVANIMVIFRLERNIKGKSTSK